MMLAYRRVSLMRARVRARPTFGGASGAVGLREDVQLLTRPHTTVWCEKRAVADLGRSEGVCFVAASRRTLASMAESAPPAVGQPGGADVSAPERSPTLGAAGWQPWTVAIAVVGAFALVLAGRAIASTATHDDVNALGLVLIVVNAAPIALALILANLHRRPTARDFALRRPPLVRAIGLLVAVWVGLTALTVLWVAALGLDGEDGQALTERLGTEGTMSVIVLVAVVTIVGPVGEEVLFRGYIFRALRNWRGVWPAAITSGVLFAATHLGWVSLALMTPIVVFGIAMCLLYHWTGSLYPCIAVHAFGNAIPLAGALDLTWQAPLLIVGSTLAALTLTRLLALGLADAHRAAP